MVFDAGGLLLEASRVVGKVAAVDAVSGVVSLKGLSGLFMGAGPMAQAIGVQTGSSTTYDGFSAADFGAIAVGDLAVAKGPLFATAGGNVVGSVELLALSAGN